MFNRQLLALIKKEFTLEFRQKASLGGVLVYVIATIFISALTFNKIIAPAVWNALFWIIFLFSAITICGKSFTKESGGAALHNYVIYKPLTFFASKLIYNFIFLLTISLITLFFYSWFIGYLISNFTLFGIVLVLACLGFSAILTLMSAIASKTDNTNTMMSILSFPVLIPVLILVLRISKQAIDGLSWSVSTDFLLILISVNAICIVLSILLFPYLWRA
ncbi:MAG: heme exporter protein CcmB [Bacteroidia bacterium]|jgi:heme exporter protein B|nr:heme exporter protein CcmB [Sphingobacteriaceae bacterium]MBK7310321.1 heme exporter protein CcmB [Sphingobacteriaceae bacterium]MBP9069409.1 heme exporter protein CcmB [Bacteroidia bacterium]